MLRVKKEGIILKKTNNGFENEAVLNPAVISDGDTIHMFYRATRKGNYSSIGYCQLDGPLNIIRRDNTPILYPEKKYESQGIEDPRISKIENLYYLTYSVYDHKNVLGAYAISSDLKSFAKKKVITPKLTFREYKHLIECCNHLGEKYLFHYRIFKEHGLGQELAAKLYVWDKNLVFFPKKINGSFALLHRIHPGIQIVHFKSFGELTKSFWENYLMNLKQHIVMDPKLPHESSHIGSGCPPIETKEGWLLIYHSAQLVPSGYIYHASAALLDLKNPGKELARLSQPLISPTEKWEKEGITNNIIFPSGATVFKNRLYIYYGAADEVVAVASVLIDELVEELVKLK